MRLSVPLALAAAVLVSLLGAPPAHAQDDGAHAASHLQAARDLLRASGTAETMAQAIDAQLDLQIQQNPEILPFRDVMVDFMTEHIGYEAMEEELVAMYVLRFSEPELREIERFYRTETGSKAARLMPEFMMEGMAIGEQAVVDHQDELEQRMRDRMAQLGMEPPEGSMDLDPAPLPAPPGVVLASDPESVVAALQAAGYPAESDVDGAGDPMVLVSTDAMTWAVYFYTCTRNASCQSLQFAAGFDFDEPVAPDVVNAWNAQSRFGKAWQDEDGNVRLQYDLIANGAGLDGAYFAELALLWENIVGAFAAHVGW